MTSFVAVWTNLARGGRPAELRFHAWSEVNQFCARAGLIPPPSSVGVCLEGVKITIDRLVAQGHIEVGASPA